MLKKLIVSVAVIVSGALIVSVTNATEEKNELTSDALKSLISKKLNFAVQKVQNTPIDGVKEIITEKGLFYVSADGKHLMRGTLYSLGNSISNLTEKSMAGIRVDGMKQFENDMIVFPAKNEKHQITVFTDISCGYCRKLHKEIEEYNNLGITVRYLAFPRGGIGSQSYQDLTSVWCADDPQKAMTLAKAGQTVSSKSCNNAIAKEYQFGVIAGVQGTPAIMLDDGMMIPGYQEPGQMIEILKNY